MLMTKQVLCVKVEHLLLWNVTWQMSAVLPVNFEDELFSSWTIARKASYFDKGRCHNFLLTNHRVKVFGNRLPYFSRFYRLHTYEITEPLNKGRCHNLLENIT